MEKRGIEEISAQERHGRASSQFTLWFAANLTVADYALGAILVTLGLSTFWIMVSIALGNAVAAVLVGLLVSQGPEHGLPQMMISKKLFGKLNLPFAAAQWISTLGWFAVNAIIGGYVLYFVEPGVPLEAWIALTGISQVLLAVYGYDVIHRSETVLSLVLGALYVGALALAIPKAHALVISGSFSPVGFAVALATVFSYLASWAPYASDYSRYLPLGTGRLRVIAYTAIGGAAASAISEVTGIAVSVATGNTSGYPWVLLEFSKGYGLAFAAAALLLLFLGALAANVLNIYSNALSLLAIYRKAGRIRAVLAGALVSISLAIVGGINFIAFFEGFLFFLDYWIMPWAGVIVSWHFLKGGKRPSINPFLIYLISLAASVPFMNITAATSGLVSFIGPASSLMGGADVSYFVSFVVALVISYIA